MSRAGRSGRPRRWGAISPRLARRLRPLPVALLATVALVQAALVRFVDLAPWSGGGFGMFSTLDAGGARHLHAYQVRPGVEREVAVVGGRGRTAPWRLASRATALPSDGALRAVARWVASQPSPDFGPPRAVRIQVFRPRFDPETLAPSSELLREVEIAVGDG